MNEEPGANPDHPLDSSRDWVARDIKAYVATDGKEGSELRGAPLLLLTTLGRKTGNWRRTALIFGKSGDDFLIVASQGGAPRHPSWYLNLQAHPEVYLQVYDRKFKAAARTANPEERPALWSIMAAVWPDYDQYARKTTRVIPVVVLTPLD